MASSFQERFEIFSTCLVNEFEMYIEVQRVIIEGETSPNANLKRIAIDSIKELFNSTGGVVGKTLSGVKDYVLIKRKLDIAGKIIKLVDKYQNPEEKKALRAMLVRVAYELFRSFEYQFMYAERSQGGWSQAMVQLARTAVWCFMHYYKFTEQEELDEKYVLEGITLKNMPNVRIWKKCYYRDEKKFSKVTNTADHVKFDGVKMYSKAGLILYKNQQPVYYKNDFTKPEKYGFRRLFSHESDENIETEYEETILPLPVRYQYLLDMGTAIKASMCEKMLKEINSKDNSLMENRLIENMKRITENIIESLMCEIMQQMVTTLNGITIPTANITSTVNNETKTVNKFLCRKQHAKKINNVNQGDFRGPVKMEFKSSN